MNFGTCETAGDGLWSHVQRSVRVIDLAIRYVNDKGTFGELVAYFDPEDWNIGTHGLIYTDSQWIREFRELLVGMGFSLRGASNVDYSEQGMQSAYYVSMDVGKHFLNDLRQCPELRLQIQINTR